MHLVVVAGVSCAGKTYRVHQSADGLAFLKEDMSDALRLDDVEFEKYPAGFKGKTLVLQYDLMRLSDYGIGSFAEDMLPALLLQAETVDVVTLWECADTLVLRCQQRRRALLFSLRLWVRPRQTLLRLARLKHKIDFYMQAKPLLAVYAGWFDFIGRQHIDSHFLMQSSMNKAVRVASAAGALRWLETRLAGDGRPQNNFMQ